MAIRTRRISISRSQRRAIGAAYESGKASKAPMTCPWYRRWRHRLRRKAPGPTRQWANTVGRCLGSGLDSIMPQSGVKTVVELLGVLAERKIEKQCDAAFGSHQWQKTTHGIRKVY